MLLFWKSILSNLDTAKAMGIRGAEKQKVSRFFAMMFKGERWTAVMPAQITTLAMMKWMPRFCFRQQSWRSSSK